MKTKKIDRNGQNQLKLARFSQHTQEIARTSENWLEIVKNSQNWIGFAIGRSQKQLELSRWGILTGLKGLKPAIPC